MEEAIATIFSDKERLRRETLARTRFESIFMDGLCGQNRVASNETMLARFA